MFFERVHCDYIFNTINDVASEMALRAWRCELGPVVQGDVDREQQSTFALSPSYLSHGTSLYMHPVHTY